MKCYNFYQQYKDYFATARGIEPILIPFMTFYSLASNQFLLAVA